uniref:Uncharacterized protein n=1 Tax=Rhinopithecus bieti TaxID=61621 RepID=A0A2K6LYK6_RHIBE
MSLNLGRHNSSVYFKRTVSQKLELSLEAQTPVNTPGHTLPVDVLGKEEGRGTGDRIQVPTRGSQDLGNRSATLV